MSGTKQLYWFRFNFVLFGVAKCEHVFFNLIFGADRFEQVNGLTVSGFARTLLTKDLREVKAAYPQSTFIVESKAFAAALTPAVDKLEKICSAVVNMHVEAMKSEA